jgi:hypothetical protein
MRASLLIATTLALFVSACSRESRQFELSASLRNFCSQDQILMCEQTNSFLAAMANEARDDTWANDTETHLRRAFEAAGQGKVELRALQCRSTRCALEYAVDGQAIDAGFEMNPDFPASIEPATGAFTYELSPRKVVVAMCFTRQGHAISR